MTRSVHSLGSQAINAQPYRSCDRYNSSPEPFNMEQCFTPADHSQFREADLDHQRVLSLGNAFTKVPFGSSYNQERVLKLGYAFTGTPMCAAQQDYIRASRAQGASAQASWFSQVSHQARMFRLKRRRSCSILTVSIYRQDLPLPSAVQYSGATYPVPVLPSNRAANGRGWRLRVAVRC